MKREIGSDFWEYNDSFPGGKEFNIDELSHNYFQYFFKSGRSALYYLADYLKHTRNVIVLPAFTCTTVVEPFKLNGWEIYYYDIDINLELNLLSLKQKINHYRPSVILLHGYFGFRTLANVYEYISSLRKQGIVIIEDITQTLYSSYPKTDADYYVASLRKWNALPEGGIILSQRKLSVAYKKFPLEKQLITAFTEACDLKDKYINNGIDNKTIFLNKYRKCKEILDETYDIYPMSKFSKTILDNCKPSDIRKTRRKNYRCLLKVIIEIPTIKPIFDYIDETITPLYFPIYVPESKKRIKLQTFLATKNIYCPIIWPKFYSYDRLCHETQYIYDHILCIPCDQRYSKEEMNYILDCLIEGVKAL